MGNDSYERTPPGFLESLVGRVRSLEHAFIRLIPSRLSPSGARVDDWNEAVQPGFYWSHTAAANGPPTTTVLSGVVTVATAGSATVVTQEVRRAGVLHATSFTRYRDSSGNWTPWRLNGMGRGTGALRAQVVPHYWDFWQDTDGDQRLYVGNKSGGWRQYSGDYSWAAAAWDTVQTSGSVVLAGRTINAVLPTVLEPNEDILAQLVAGGSGFTFIGPNAVTRGASNTTLTFRYMQIGASTQQAGRLVWQIVQI